MSVKCRLHSFVNHEIGTGDHPMILLVCNDDVCSVLKFEDALFGWRCNVSIT